MAENISGIVGKLGDRLHEWRRTYDLRLKDVSERIGISQGSLSDLENNNSLPSAETIARFHLRTNINIFWLMFNESPKLRKNSASGFVEEEFKAYGKDHNAIVGKLGDRLHEWRKSSDLRLKDVSERIGISQGSLSDLENNNSLPSAETIARLHAHTDINIFWLMFNLPPKCRKKTGAEVVSSYCVNEESTEYQTGGRKLDAGLRDLIERVIRIYEKGDPGKIAHLKGFLQGADPG